MTVSQIEQQTATAPADIDADFVFRCYDDSMINIRLFDGDLVFIRECEDVEDGQIAAIRVNEFVVLRRIYHGPDYLELRPENPKYPPFVAHAKIDEIEILGVAVKALCNVF